MTKPAVNGLTLDSILGGRLRLYQPADGYRFSFDAVLLARFIRARRRDRVLELGAGCGVVSITVAALEKPRQVVALELQPALATLIARNAALNELSNVWAVCADLRRPVLKAARFDLVIANPPYRALRRGRESPKYSRRIARGAAGASLAEFLDTAARAARDGAAVALVFTASRTAELIAELRARALEPKRIRFVHPRAQRRASVILIEARKGGGVEVEVEPPLMLYAEPGIYSREAIELLKGAP